MSFLGCCCLFFDAEKFRGRFENHAVNDLFGQMHFVEPDMAFVVRLRLLHRDVEPVLLLHGIAAAFVVAGRVGLFVQFVVGGMESFAEQSAARRAANYGDGIIVSQLAAKSRAARAQTDISGGPGHGGAAREQTQGTGKRNELDE
jgi:hypothetical protein